ncbi:MAG: DUF1444 family protein [Planktomarina sp.]
MRHFLIPFFMLLATPIFAQIAMPTSPHDTLELMRDAALRHASVETAIIDVTDQSLILNQGTDAESTMYPDNLHRKLLNATDDDRQMVFDEHMERTLNGTDLAYIQGGTILPIIRHLDYFTTIPDAPQMATTPFIAELVVAYAEDTPTSVSIISKDRLDELGMTIGEVHTLALANLQTHETPLSVKTDPVYHLGYDGFYESSWLLIDTVWAQIEDQVGPIVLAVPNRSFVLFAPISDQDAVRSTVQLAGDLYQNNAYPITDKFFTWDVDHWELYQP